MKQLITFFFCSILFSCNLKKSKTYEGKINEVKPIVNSNKLNIEGLYTIENDTSLNFEKCNLSILITKNKNKYHYKFKSDLRELNGNFTINENTSEGFYFTLEGIEWSEFEGDVTEEKNDSIEKQDLDLPIGIKGVIYKDEITIQNYGNAMNYYVQLEDCGQKYIHLKKINSTNK